jgi:hypothetical protein
MRTRLLVSAVLMAAAATVHAGQEPQKKPDDRTITVTGCVDKGYLQVKAVDGFGGYTERYKLRGSKQLVKEIAAKYDRHLLEVVGVVADLNGNTEHRGKTVPVGKKTTIHTGAKDVPRIPTGSDATLEVQSFREMKDSCG